MILHYNWQASLAILVIVVATVAIGRLLLLRLPAFKQTLAFNKEENKTKYRNKKKYPHRIKSTQQVSLITNLVFFVAILPFIATFEAQPVWTILLNCVLILMVYDFFYYMTHRFVFHGQGYFRRVHAVHHQARKPTSIDAMLLDPMEAFIGIALFVVVCVAISIGMGEPLNIATYVITMAIYTQLNQFNHVHVELDRFPYKTLNWIANKHAIHHIDMHKGNYATITLLFDRMFGTLD